MISLIPKKKPDNLLLTKILEIDEYLNRVKVKGLADQEVWVLYEPSSFPDLEVDEIVAVGFTNDDPSTGFLVQRTANNMPITSEIYEI